MQKEINEALAVLKNGGVILYPTDTIWGLGCDATNAEALNKLNRIKQRDEGKSMILLLDQDARLNRYVKEVPDVAWDLLDVTTTPITIVYPNAIALPPQAIANDGSIAIRVVKEGFAHELIRRFGKPITSTSANANGQPPGRSAADVDPQILEQVDYVVKSKEVGSGKPSTILKLSVNGEFQFIRK